MATKRERAVGYFVAQARDTGHAFLERGTGERARCISAVKDGDGYEVVINHWGMEAVIKHVQLRDLADEVYGASIL